MLYAQTSVAINLTHSDKFAMHALTTSVSVRSPSFRSARPEDPPNRIWALYESCGVRGLRNTSPSKPWAIGLVHSDTGVTGPWIRYSPKPLQLGGCAENPLVVKSTSGLYLLLFATNKYGVDPGGLGFGWSKDGINWEKNTEGLDSGLSDQIVVAAPAPHSAVRTPLALVGHSSNRFVFYFTSFEGEHQDTDCGHPPKRKHEHFEAMYATEFELVFSKSHGQPSLVKGHAVVWWDNPELRVTLSVVVGVFFGLAVQPSEGAIQMRKIACLYGIVVVVLLGFIRAFCYASLKLCNPTDLTFCLWIAMCTSMGALVGELLMWLVPACSQRTNGRVEQESVACQLQADRVPLLDETIESDDLEDSIFAT